MRSSHHEAIRTHQRLLEQLTAAQAAKRVVYERLIRMLKLEPDSYRPGHSAIDRQLRFAAVAALAGDSLGDTLMLVPYPVADYSAGRHHRELSRLAEALDHARSIARRAAQEWTRDFPDDAAAHTTFARVLELRGEITAARAGSPSALAEVHRARELSTAAIEQLELRRSEVRLLIKKGDFAAAGAAVDSALMSTESVRARSPSASSSDEEATWVLASLAALTGRAITAADLLYSVRDDAVFRLPNGAAYRPPPDVAGTAQRLLAFAATGAPPDSIRELRERLERQIESYVPAVSRDSVRVALLARPLSLAVPILGPDFIVTLPRWSPGLVPHQQALARGDTADVRKRLDADQEPRRAFAPGAVMLDRSYQEAWLRLAMHDTTAAIKQLDAALEALPTVGTSLLEQVPTAAALAHTLRLRADIAAARGETVIANRWRSAAAALLRQAYRDMKR
jgi:tetratricopeptide (TPR) repeat protein